MLRQGALTIDARTVVEGWQKLVLLGALVFLPVPVLTAIGLAVPIPSLVYQVASGLATRTQAIVVQLPGFQAIVADEGGESHEGVIRRSAAELSAPGTAIDLRPVGSGGPETGSNRGSRPGAKDSPVAVGDDTPAGDQGPTVETRPGEGSTGTPAVVVPTRPDPPPPPPPPPANQPPPPVLPPVELPITPPKIEIPPLPPPPIRIPLPPPPKIPGIPG